MTPLETAIASAIARTPRERELPGAVMAAIEREGYVVLPTGDWRWVKLVHGGKEKPSILLSDFDLDPSAEKRT